MLSIFISIIKWYKIASGKIPLLIIKIKYLGAQQNI